jgi:hypothetical protein
MSYRSPVNATNGAPSQIRHQLAPGRQRLVLLIAVLLGVALLAAACGGGAASPGVANVGSKTTTTSASGSPAGNSGSPPSATLQKAQLAYAVCMRKHGVPNFPDPNVGGGYPDGYMKNINASSPEYVSGTKDCRPLTTAAGSRLAEVRTEPVMGGKSHVVGHRDDEVGNHGCLETSHAIGEHDFRDTAEDLEALG